MEEQNTTFNPRPTFLTVLCILSFLGSGWGIIDSITDYVNAEQVGEATELIEESMDDAMDKLDENEDISDTQRDFVEGMAQGFTENITPENIRKSAIVTLISCLLTLAGALLMWKLNKNGFYLYIAGFLVMIIGLVSIFSGVMGAIAAGGSGFIGVVMIVLYGVNLKHMN